MMNASLSVKHPNRIAALDRYAILDTPVEEAFEELVKLAASVCQAKIAGICFIDDERQWFKAEMGLGIREVPLADTAWAACLLEHDFLMVPDTRMDARFADSPLVTSTPYLRSYAGALLQSKEGHALGALCVFNFKSGQLDRAQAAALRTLARQVMTLLEYRHALRAREQAIAEQQALQEQLRLAVEGGRANERWLRGILAATPECVKLVDVSGRILFINPAGREMIGADPECEEGLPECTVFDLIAPADQDRWREMHRRVCAGEKLSWQFELISPKGARHLMETRAVPLHLPGDVTVQLSVTRDITERKQVEQQREQLLESERRARCEAERVGRAKDEFLATLSHELRTPLNAVLGWASLMRMKKTVQPEELARGLETIERNALVQAHLIEDLLDMSAIISGKVHLDLQPVLPAAIISSTVASVELAANAKNIRIAAEYGGVTGGLFVDAKRFQQVFWNLLSNAIKFTPEGGSIHVRCRNVAAGLEIAISDTGPGIKPEFLPHVFERFRQADASTTRVHGGLGLGLAISKQLVELHGGRIEVTSEGCGRGATFTVCFPLVGGFRRVSRPSAPCGQENLPGDELPLPLLEGLRLLVVDDEADARELVRKVLMECRAEVVGAASAGEALSLLPQVRPHLVISDIGMPGMDGYALVRRLRGLRDPVLSRIPAIALTAFAGPGDRDQALDAGYSAHAAKPAQPLELARLVADLTGRPRVLTR